MKIGKRKLRKLPPIRFWRDCGGWTYGRLVKTGRLWAVVYTNGKPKKVKIEDLVYI